MFFILDVKSLKFFLMNKKGWKRPKKNVLTSFLVHPAPETWLKYTTPDKAAKHNLFLNMQVWQKAQLTPKAEIKY